MKVLLIKNNRLYGYRLPDTIKNNFWITDIDNYDNSRNLINVVAKDGKWVLTSNYETQVVSGEKVYDEVVLNDYNFYVIKNESEQSYYYLYALPNVDDTYKFYNIATNGSLKIGKATDCNILYGHALIEANHAELFYQDGLWQIVDNNSKFGVYVNDKRIAGAYSLNYGDVIFIAGLKIVVMNGFILINNINNFIKVTSDILTFKQNVSYKLDNSVLKEEELDRNLYSKEEFFYRSPRFIEDIMKEEIVIEDPPQKQEEPDNSLIMTIGPMFTMSLTSMVTAYSTISNMSAQENPDWSKATPALVMAGAMLLSTLVWPLINRMVEKRKREKNEQLRVEKYSKYLQEKKKEIQTIIQKQTQTLKDKYIPLSDCENIILRRRPTLWERAIEQRDFLSLRLGLGNLPIFADVKYSPEHFSLQETDEMRTKIISVVEENKTLNNVPIVISLVEKYITSLIGDQRVTSEFFKGLLLQMMAYHSYEFLKIVVLTDNENAYRWNYLHNLPYIFDDLKQTRFFATNIDEVREVSLYLEKIYQDRKAMDVKNYCDIPPYYLIITDNYHMYRDIEIINDVLKQPTNIGFGLMIMSPKLQNLPSECKNFINVNPDISGIFESEISQGHQQEFKTEFCDKVDVNECIRRISNIPIEFNDEEKQLPKSISFLEMYGVGKIDQLNVYNRWMMNNSQKSLSVPVGLEKSGSLLKLDLHEKYHGPHGLIAGMTGSGKSEFIITYILSLAINFSPLDVNFILIDYKGGGLAGAFENRETGIRLPHLAGTITNLDVAEMNRSLASIQSELRRRQQIFNDARDKLGESTVDIYKYQKFFKDGQVTEPVPHLFIISDEFAELKSQQPEFMDQLISAARIGRSLGIHLILATQKPSGVVNDQIWSNTRFRVCLKVQDKSDSTEMIKRPDAALLTNAGRFYLQVGYNELFALGQAAWCGAQYVPTEKIRKKVDQSINIIDNIGNILSTSDDEVKEKHESLGEELGNILKYIIQISKENNIKTKQLWLEKILPDIYVDNLVQKYEYQPEKFILNPVIGEFDDPNNQRQGLVTINLTNDGNTSIYGSAGSGKELFVGTMIYSLITTHTPDEVNIYILDFGAGTLGTFRNMPHVGDVVMPTDDEKIDNLFKLIENEVAKRKKLFVNYNGDYQSYVRRSGKTVPYILLFINNYDAFQDSFDYDDRINQLTRDCVKYGIIIIPTINTTSGMRYKLRQNFKSDIVLQFNDQDDYSIIVGNTRKLYPSAIFGRGLIKTGDGLFEFQTAHSYKDEEYQDKMEELAKELNAKYPNGAIKVPVVPRNVLVDDIAPYIKNLQNVPVGINKATIDAEYFNVRDNFTTLVSASEVETTTNFMKGFVKVLSKVPNTNVVIFDTDGLISSEYDKNVSYIKDNFDGYLSKIIDAIKMQYDKYVADGYNNKNLINNKSMVITIVGFGKFLLRITPENKASLFDYLEKIKDLQTFSFVLVDIPESMRKNEYEKWYKAAIDANYGIWVGNGVADQNLIKTNIGFKKTNNEVLKGYGVVVKNTKTNLVNLVGDIEESGDDE